MIFLVCFGACLRPHIVPEPLHLEYSDSYFTLSKSTKIWYDQSIERLDSLATYIQQWILGATGWELEIISSSSPTGIILSGTTNQTATDESYVLSVTSSSVKMEAKTYTGFLYAFTTLLQLFPPEIYSLSPEIECKLVQTEQCRAYEWTAPTVDWKAQCAVINDEPRFGYRGILLDTSRHFFSVDIIKRLMRIMALHKLNRLHLHLTDDPGCRFESKKYPNLADIGSVRSESPLPWNQWQGDGKQYGPLYYTQEQLKDLVNYGDSLGIIIIPEFELPGHALGALAGYCQYSCQQQPLAVSSRWGNSIEIFCPGNDEAIDFLKGVLDEVCDIFPSTLIHVGGDEVDKTRWNGCAKCQARIKQEGLSGTQALQGWFISQFAEYLEQKGRRLVGWGEILDGGVAKSSVVMTWQGSKAMIEAVNLDMNAIDSDSLYFYFNFKQFPHTDDIYEYNEYFSSDFITYYWAYQKDSHFGIPKDKRHLVLGVQAAAWSEFIWGGEDDLHYKLFPRTTALAEVGWTKPSNKNWYRHITGQVRVHRKRMVYMGVKSAPLVLNSSPKWEGKDLTTEWKQHTWDLSQSIKRKCAYQAAFIKTSGVNDLKVRNVRVFVNGEQWGYDLHEGKASFRPNYSAFFEWEFKEEAPTDAKIEVIAELCGDGGTDCYGEVAVMGTTFETTVY